MPLFFLEGVWRLAFQKMAVGTTVLVVGLDNDQYVQRTDTIMLLHLDEKASKVNVLSVPRDTLINVPKMGLTKINHAYGLGGIELLQNTLTTFLDLPIDYTVQVNLASVEKVIDILGGVEVDVKKKLSYQDKAGNLSININKGKQRLNGAQVTEYARFRSDSEGDIGRIQRQQRLLQSSVEQLRKSMSPTTFIKLVPEINALIDTDMPLSKMMQLIKFAFKFDFAELKSLMIPGHLGMRQGVSYWIPEVNGLDRLVDQFFNARFATPILNQNLIVSKESAQIEKLKQNTKVKPKVLRSKQVKQMAKIETVKKAIPLIEGDKASLVKEDDRASIEPSDSFQSNQKLFNHKETQSVQSKEKQNIQEVEKLAMASSQDSDIKNLPLKKIRIEVLNGNGQEGIAKKVAAFLTKHHFEVIKVGDAKDYLYERSKLVDWKGNVNNALEISKWLHLKEEDLVLLKSPKKPLDMSLVIGHNWKEIEALLNNE